MQPQGIIRLAQSMNLNNDDMNWRKLENTFDVAGMFVLVKGTRKHNGLSFYEVGRLVISDNGIVLVSVVTKTRAREPMVRELNYNECDYWYINIDEIK